MSFLNSNNFADRQAAAANARKALAEKFLSRPKYDPNDPAVIEREAKRRAILEARELREVERQKRKAEEAAAEAARREEEAKLEYERKLDRDARYAARKERKKKAKSAPERYR